MTDKRAAFLGRSVAMGGFMIGRFAGTAMMRLVTPVRLLAAFAVTSAALLVLAINTSGMLSVGLLMAVPFFVSIVRGAVIPVMMGRVGRSGG